jgi:hypothetical protein
MFTPRFLAVAITIIEAALSDIARPRRNYFRPDEAL